MAAAQPDPAIERLTTGMAYMTAGLEQLDHDVGRILQFNQDEVNGTIAQVVEAFRGMRKLLQDYQMQIERIEDRQGTILERQRLIIYALEELLGRPLAGRHGVERARGNERPGMC